MIGKKIGSGAFAKVKQATRFFENDEGVEERDEYALKIMHKPTLKRCRAARYDENGKMQNIDNLTKVYNEIDVWTKCLHPSITRIYEMIDSDTHDYLYIIMELAELGQLATWDCKIKKYIRN
jgi:serine/threonine protein kinase